MLKLAFETLLNESFVYERNPNDSYDTMSESKPLKFTHLLIQTNGAQMFYNEHTSKVYTDLTTSHGRLYRTPLDRDYSVVEVSRSQIGFLQEWMTSVEHYAVRLEYRGPKLPVRVHDYVDHLLNSTSRLHTNRSSTGYLVAEAAGEVPDNLNLLISCEHDRDGRVLAVFNNYEVREVLYNPFEGKYEFDMVNKPLVQPGPDAEIHYQQIIKELARRNCRLYTRKEFTRPKETSPEQ